MVQAFVLVGPQGWERVGVPCGDDGIQAGSGRGRGVRSYPSLAFLHGSGWRGREPTGRWLGRQLVEAGERLGLAIGVEPLPACQEAVGSEDPEQEEVPLEGASTDADGARGRPAHEERVGSQAEDVVDARGKVFRDLEQGAESAQECLGSAGGPKPEEPVVDELDGGREDRGPAIEVMWSQHHRDRARRRRGAGACGPVGEEVGVALVQAGDGGAEPVGGEDLGPPASPMWIDLDQDDLVDLVGTDIGHPVSCSACSARRHGHAVHPERVAEGRQRLVQGPRVSSLQQGAKREEHSLRP